MKILRIIFRFYIESSIHVALAICALAGVSVFTFDLKWDWHVFTFLFFASVTGYNFVKYAGQAKLHHRSLTHQLKSIQIFSLFCFLGLIYVSLLQTKLFMETSALLGVFTFLYAVPFLPNQKNLRSLKSLKIFIIALVWAGATLWLPLVDQKPVFSIPVLYKTLSYFVFVLALILPFEIRDLKYDQPELGTLPQRFGIPKTKTFGYTLLVVYIILNLLNPYNTQTAIVSSCLIALLVGVFIYFSHKNQSDYYAAFWVEAVPIFWIILCLLLNL